MTGWVFVAGTVTGAVMTASLSHHWAAALGVSIGACLYPLLNMMAP